MNEKLVLIDRNLLPTNISSRFKRLGITHFLSDTNSLNTPSIFYSDLEMEEYEEENMGDESFSFINGFLASYIIPDFLNNSFSVNLQSIGKDYIKKYNKKYHTFY